MLERMCNSYCCKNRIEKSSYGPVKIATVYLLQGLIASDKSHAKKQSGHTRLIVTWQWLR